jgi:hypothetical protein
MASVRKGDRIRLIKMPNDPDPIPPGSEGVVVEVTEGPLVQIVVEWIGLKRSLALIPGVDVFQIIDPACLRSGGEQPQ